MKKISIIGCGNIGLAIAEGLVQSEDFNNKDIIATKRDIIPLKKIADAGVYVESNNAKAVQDSEYIIIAVKPFKVMEILDEIKPFLRDDQVLISVASEISIADILTAIERPKQVVFRAMPNTAASIQESITCISDQNASTHNREAVNGIFKAIGDTVFIEEDLMEAATILGACGIAYVLRFIRAMIQGGIQIGFDAKTASKITTQTVKGAAELLIQKKSHPESEIDKVTTPKGCTITGLNEMEHQGFSSALIKGITKSFEKIEH